MHEYLIKFENLNGFCQVFLSEFLGQNVLIHPIFMLLEWMLTKPFNKKIPYFPHLVGWMLIKQKIK